MKKHIVLLFLLIAGQEAYCLKNSDFKFTSDTRIYVCPDLLKDSAIQEAIADLSDVFFQKWGKKPLLYTLSAQSGIHQSNSQQKDVPPSGFRPYDFHQYDLIIDTAAWEGKDKEEAFSLEKKIINGKLVLVAKAATLRAVCYAIYFLREKLMLGGDLFKGNRCYKKPDFIFRMITQPFEVAGFAPVSTLEKPVVLNRQFDPMRPFDGAGYAPDAEAKNILRAGMNTFYIGSYTFATTYSVLSDTLFPPGSEGRKWVDQRRAQFRAQIRAAEKYHLLVCVNSDVFAYPKALNYTNRWKALKASLNEILTDFPEIDVVVGRFGENYSYFNPWFTGKGPQSDEELAKVIDTISAIAVKKYGKIFMPRTWSLGNACWHADTALYRKITEQIKADTGVVFSVKNTQTDFWRYNRFNPTLGKGSKKQAIEYLCQDGYHFKSSFPNYEVIRMARGSNEIDGAKAGMKAARDMGINYTWGWLSADGWCGPYLKREEWLQANIYGYTHLMWNAGQQPETLARHWAALAFHLPLKSKSAATIAGILMDSEEMMLKTCYFKTFSTTHNGWLPALNWQRDDVIGGGTNSHSNTDCQFSVCPGQLREIFNSHTIAADCREKKEAYEIAVKMLKKYDSIKSSLPDQRQAQEVRNTLLSGQYLTAILYHYVNGAFRYYNAEPELAEKHLRQWQVLWADYNHKISVLPGAPSPMQNGGMVETCEEMLDKLANQFK